MSILFLRVFFTLSLAALGGFVPQLGARLEALGLTGVQLGLLLAILPAGRILSAPAWGWLADRFQVGGVLIRAGALVSMAGMVAVWRADSVGMAGVGLALFSVGRSPLGPVVDAFTVDAIRVAGRDAREYGRTRLWGSVGFLVAAQVSGAAGALRVDPLVVGVAVMGVCAACTLGFPARGGAPPAPIGPALRALASQPGFTSLLAFGACQAFTVNIYDTFFSVHVRALGLPSTVTSTAVLVGVGVEIAVMAAGRPLLARLGSDRALVIAAVTGIPRWLLTAWLVNPVALVAVQVLHGTSFALFWLGGVDAVSRRSAGSAVSASAQSLWSTATYGLGALAGAGVAGVVRQELGTAAIFYACAGVSCVALWFALRAQGASSAPAVGVAAPTARRRSSP